jgi:two-component system, NarL family, sensor histidine kinase UhpB
MKNTLSLRYQINLRIVLTSIIILILGGIIAIEQARLSVKTELDSSLNLAVQLIKLNFQSEPKHGTVDLDAWLPRFVSLEQTRHLTMTETKKGFGLLAIRERIKSLGGELNIQTGGQQNMKITASISLA